MKNGYKMTEIGVIPVDWEVNTFKNICWVNQGLQIPIEKRLKYPTIKSKKYITIQYLNDGKAIEYIDDYSLSVCCKTEEVLMTRTGNTGVVITDVEGVFHNNFFKINFDKKRVNREFLIYYLKDTKTQKIILEKAGTSTIPDLNHNDFYSIKIPIPPLPEQKAIAEVLSDTDNLIQAIEKRIAKKRLIKQGAMQKLLSPKDDWEVKKLGEIAELKMGQSPSSSNYNNSGIGLPLVQGNADIKNRETIIRNYTSQITKKCNTGDIIMSVRAPVGEIARAIFKACIGRGVCAIFYPNNFLYHYLIFIEPQWAKHSTGSTFDSVNSDAIRELEIPFPSKQEQTHFFKMSINLTFQLYHLLINYRQRRFIAFHQFLNAIS